MEEKERERKKNGKMAEEMKELGQREKERTSGKAFVNMTEPKKARSHVYEKN